MDPKAKRQALRAVTYGMYVVGCVQGERVHAVTINWLTQCSFEPPLVVWACQKGAISYRMIKASRVFSVNVPERGDTEFLQLFFKAQPQEPGRLGGLEYAPGVTGAPIFRRALVWWECELVDVWEQVGDHALFIGRVVNAGVNRAGEPLAMAETGWRYAG